MNGISIEKIVIGENTMPNKIIDEKSSITFTKPRIVRTGDPVAIVGLGSIMPDANDIETFWNNIKSGKDLIREIPKSRWDPELYYDADRSVPDKTYSKIGSFVTDFKFNGIQFRIPPKVSDKLDLVQQMALTAANEALEDAGLSSDKLNTENTGVIIGNSMGGEIIRQYTRRVYFPEVIKSLQSTSEYTTLTSDKQLQLISELESHYLSPLAEITEDSMPGELANVIAGRISNVFNLRGKNLTTDAACASSIAAVDLAYKSLVNGEVDAVVSGGADRSNEISSYVKFCKIGALSATGSRPFDKDADGFVMGEGVGFFVLKRLEDAINDGNKIYAIIRGVGSSSDGKGKGITAPNPIGQEIAIRRALNNTGIDPKDISLIEAHGTSTAVGDVVEVSTLEKVYKEFNVPVKQVALGSIKSQIGHLKSSAGAAAVLKVALALHNKLLPPSINFVNPNPKIDWINSPFYVNTTSKPWDHNPSKPRRAAISSFGFGGTNFHLIMEEYLPNYDYSQENISQEMNQGETFDVDKYIDSNASLLSEAYFLTADTENELIDKSNALLEDLKESILFNSSGEHPLPIKQRYNSQSGKIRLGFTVSPGDDLDKLQPLIVNAIKKENTRKAAQVRGIFISTGLETGKVAFLFPGQGSQYSNMLVDLKQKYQIVQDTFNEADKILSDFLGRKLSEIIFGPDETKAERDNLLKQTQITQPAMLVADIAIYRLLHQFGFKPDIVAGHSLGEFVALVAAEVLSFSDALMAVAIRGKAMSEVDSEDKGSMASISGNLDEIVKILEEEVDGYVIAANKNSTERVVISGSTEGINNAIKIFEAKRMKPVQLSVSAAFHSKIVAPAAETLSEYLRNIKFNKPRIPVSSNVLGDFYPEDPELIRELLEKQVESPVEWTSQVKSMFENGVKTFLEVGPKRALASFVSEILVNEEIISIVTNHPKKGGITHFNEALCAGYALKIPLESPDTNSEVFTSNYRWIPRGNINYVGSPKQTLNQSQVVTEVKSVSQRTINGDQISQIYKPQISSKEDEQLFNDFIQTQQDFLKTYLSAGYQAFKERVRQPQSQMDLLEKYGINLDKIVITGAGIGLPGKHKEVFDPKNVEKILNGENFIDLVSDDQLLQQTNKGIVRLVKDKGNASFETINTKDAVIKLAGQPGRFDLVQEYQLAEKMIDAYDITTELAIAAGLEALKDAGIPLVRSYNKTSTGSYLPGDWELPYELRDSTGVIFASAFPGYDALVQDISNFYRNKYSEQAIDVIRQVYGEISRKLSENGKSQSLLKYLDHELEDLENHKSVYEFNRKFLFRILSMGHSQFAQLIKAYGPNTQTNAACASTTQAVGVAEDWIRNGRCKRVIIISADNVSNENLFEWIGSGFLASGAATTKKDIREAALPFDRRRHGMIVGMGAVGLVMETKEEAKRRGIQPIIEVVGTHYSNSAFHGTRLDVQHISLEMKRFLQKVTRMHGYTTDEIADSCMFMSHETYTPARGGSASAEINSIRETFGSKADQIIVANTKGFTGHPMGAGIEDAIAIKAIEYGIIPPIANFKEPDESLGNLRLSRGERKDVDFAFRIAAGFGSQLAFALYKKAFSGQRKTGAYNQWLMSIGGSESDLIMVGKSLRLRDKGATNASIIPEVEHPVLVKSPTDQKGNFRYQPVQKPQAPKQYSGTVLQIIAQKYGYPESVLTDFVSPVQDLGIEIGSLQELIKTIDPKVDTNKITEEITIKNIKELVQNKTTTIANVSEQQPKNVQQITNHSSVKPTNERKTTSLRSSSEIIDQITDIISQKTGYPKEMLEPELDMESDLGIDTVKQAELFGNIREHYAIPFDDTLDLSSLNTISKISEFIQSNSSDSTTFTESVVETHPQATNIIGSDDVLSTIIDIISDKTGYPKEMLEPELDMEADLGIDTVKQAELIGVIREHYNIPFREDLDISQYNTISRISGFVAENLGTDTDVSPSLTKQSKTMKPNKSEIFVKSSDEIIATVVDIISDKTGYPKEMLEPELDMEADLGIDTVKQAELIGVIREHYNIPFKEDLDISNYNTIEKIAGFITDNINGGPLNISVSEVATTKSSAKPSEGKDNVLNSIVEIISDKTGYPKEMLEPELDMEADLGIDTVKQAELIGVIREHYDIPFQEDLDISNYNTISKVADFVLEFTPEEVRASSDNVTQTSGQHNQIVESLESEESKNLLALFKSVISETTGYPLSLLTDDVNVFSDLGLTQQQFDEVLKQISKQIPIASVSMSEIQEIGVLVNIANRLISSSKEITEKRTFKYYLRELEEKVTSDLSITNPLIVGYKQEKMDQISNLFDSSVISEKVLIADTIIFVDPSPNKNGRLPELFEFFKENIKSLKTIILVATRKSPSIHALTPYQGALGGMLKTLQAEFDVNCKIIITDDLKSNLLKTELNSTNGVEVILNKSIRYIVALEENTDEFKKFNLEANDAILVTGGAQGITFECLNAIVTQDVKVGIIGRSEILDNAEKIANASEDEIKSMKKNLLQKLKETHDKVTPVILEKEWSKFEKSAQVWKSLHTLKSNGVLVSYQIADVRDKKAMKTAIDQIRKELDVAYFEYIIHGAGIEISRPTLSKSLDEFNLVFDVKAKGYRNIIENIDKSKIKRLMAFSSVAGRFGNATQIDYSAANEYIAKQCAKLSSEGVKASVIDWSAWADIGMATRGSTMTVLNAAGVTPIPPEEGVKHFIHEFGYGEEIEVLVSGQLGMLASKAKFYPIKDGAEKKSKQTEKVAKIEEKENKNELVDRSDLYPEYPMIHIIEDNSVGRLINLEEDLYLEDHRIEGKAVLPGVMGLELMAEFVKTKDYKASEYRNVQFSSPIKLPKDNPLEIFSLGESNAFKFDVSVKSKFIGPDGKQLGDLRNHFSAELWTTSQIPSYPLLSSAEMNWFNKESIVLNQEKIYEIFFHGPTFQVLENITTLGNVSLGATFNFPTGKIFSNNKYEDTEIHPLLIEACFQTAGMYDLIKNSRMSLPAGIERMILYNANQEVKFIFAIFLYNKDNYSHYNVYGISETGSVVVELINYSMIITGNLELEKFIEESPKITADLDFAQLTHMSAKLKHSFAIASIDALEGISKQFVENYLTEPERIRYSRLKVKKRKLDWLSGILTAKRAISIAYGIPEMEIDMIQDEKGKPKGIWNSTDHIVSKTHSNGIAISISSRDQAVGVDLERIENRDAAFIKTGFTKDEQVNYKLNAEKELELTCLWSVKEAALKAQGTGLRDNLLKTSIIGEFNKGDFIIETPNGKCEVKMQHDEKWALSVAKAVTD
jgi:malonyl CoA-acyl carrier protein transacylase